MIKFYTTENLAKLEQVTNSAIKKRVIKKKHDYVSVSQTMARLIMIEGDNSDPAVISLMNLKGGCGKTTTAVHLAVMLAMMEFNVLLIDTDHQNQCESFFPETPFQNTIMDVFQGRPIQDCIYPIDTPNFKLDMIFSDYEFALIVPDILSNDILKASLEPIKENYDFIVIDTSPNFDIVARNVARASTHIVIPLTPTPLHIKGLEHNFKAIRISMVEEKAIAGILPTIVKENLAQHKAYLKLLQQDYPDLMFNAFIPEDINIPKAVDFRTNVFDFKEKGKGSQALKRFTWELLQRL